MPILDAIPYTIVYYTITMDSLYLIFGAPVWVSGRAPSGSPKESSCFYKLGVLFCGCPQNLLFFGVYVGPPDFFGNSHIA